MQNGSTGTKKAEQEELTQSTPSESNSAKSPNGSYSRRLPRILFFEQDSVEDDRQRRQYLLRLLILAVGVLLLFSLPVTAVIGLLKENYIIPVVVGFISLLVCFYLNQRKQVSLAGYIFIILLLALLLGRGFLLRLPLISEITCFLALSGLIVVAGLVVDEIAPFLVAIAGIAIFLAYFFGQDRLAGLNSEDRAATIQVIFFGIGLHLILAALAWGNARTVRRLLVNLAWQNEKLMEFNQQLGHNLEVSASAGDTISDLASELTLISHDQTERAENQVQSVAMVSATLEELSMTARQIAEVAENVFTATEQALKKAESGGQAVGDGINGIDTVRHKVEDIATIVAELNIQSNRIGQIVELITDLAEETNLLALNATIEAAGAGEYGRRFAVIASEVQDLSTRSRASARDVQQILGQIKTSISNTLIATEQGRDEARRVAQIANEAGEAIEQIIETVESTNQLARQIHLTTQQQKSATDQAVEMIRLVATDAREAAGGAQNILTVSNQLGDTATNLRQD